MESQKKSEKFISDEEFVGLWQDLNRNQQRFAVAMLEAPTKKEAALEIGVEPASVYHWPDVLDDVIDYLIVNAAKSAFDLLVDSVVKAAAVKRAGLDSDNEHIRQDVSSDILDRVLGRATQHTEITGEDGGPVKQEITEIVVEHPNAEPVED